VRFLILSQYFSPEVGAPQTRLSAFARELIRAGHSVEVVTAMPNYPRGRIHDGYRGRFIISEKTDGISIHRVWVYAALGASWRRAASFASFAVTSLFGLRRCQRPDWVFVESPPLTAVLPGVMASRVWRVPLIMNVADLWPDSLRALEVSRGPLTMKFLYRLERFAYTRAECLIAITEGVRHALIQQKGVPPSKVTILSNGADCETFRPMPADRELKRTLGVEKKGIVLFAGNHGYAQGLENALAAARQLQDESVQFLFLGDGSAKAGLVRLAAEWEMANVTFLNPVAPMEVARYFSIADCGLACQRDVVVLEGNRPAKLSTIMACGKPVVFAGKGEGAQLVEAAGAGVVVRPEDAVVLANAIRELLADPERAAIMGANGRAYALSNLDWKLLARDWLRQMGPRRQDTANLKHVKVTASEAAAGRP